MATEMQKKKWANMFKMFDINEDGKIEQTDFDQFAERMAKMRQAEMSSPPFGNMLAGFTGLLQAFEQMTGSKSISLDQWVGFWSNVAQNPEMYQTIRQTSGVIFSVLDADGDGQVSLEEYRKLCGVMRLEPTYADGIFAKLDLNQDAMISMDELMTLADQYFVGDDPNAPGNFFFGPI